tara:strand:+ start:8232 stop:9212 length:981 start_codon:yes stop_codon:yes gene_type:complete
MKILAAVIGSGIGKKHIEAIDGHKFSKVRIICEKNKSKHPQLKKKYRFKEIISNEDKIFKNKAINLVSIASYDEYHYKQILECIKYNKHIIVEKPMCLNEKQLLDVKRKLAKKKVKLFSNLVLRVNSLFKDIRKKIKKDEIYYLEGDYIWGRKNKLFGWRSKTKQYSITLGAGIHMIDLINWILRSRPKFVSSFAHDKVTKGTKFKKKSFNISVLEYPKNIFAKITSNCVANYQHYHELKIFSKDQTIINNLQGKLTYSNGKVKKLEAKYPDKNNRKKLIYNFLDCISKNKQKPIITTKEQFDLMSICFAIDKSALVKKRIKIEYV